MFGPAVAPLLDPVPSTIGGVVEITEPATGEETAPLECRKRPYQPSVIIRKRRHGWRARQASRGGRLVVLRRREKGRWRLTA